ncbi:hypothetical protein O181_108505 [Austropuccinia psidii MF-1]|uniref:Uncharacterized protein n=1 Tax=Austropuccinia psidii MF-1 TaxID=1389203 RepID=A0A9Q3PPM9_9BASI|nr:hypothetical protein [Austropuccinia psidii MF-1]
MVRSPCSVGAIGGPLGAILLGTQGFHGTKKWPMAQFSPTWLVPIERVQDHQDPGLPEVSGEVLGDEFDQSNTVDRSGQGITSRRINTTKILTARIIGDQSIFPINNGFKMVEEIIAQYQVISFG